MPPAEVPNSRPPRLRPIFIELPELYPEIADWIVTIIKDREMATRVLNQDRETAEPLAILAAQIYLAMSPPPEQVRSRGGNALTTMVALFAAVIAAALLVGWCLR